MAKISERQIQDAVSRIVEKEQRPKTPTPAVIAERNRIWARRHLAKRLQPVFAEAGLDLKKINDIISDHQNEFREYLKSQDALTDKAMAELTQRSREALINKRAALEHLIGKPLTLSPIAIDRPASIYANPSGMLVDDHIESWNSWAKVIWEDDNDIYGKFVSVRFLFAWENSSEFVSVINVNSDVVVRGQCTLYAFPGYVLGGLATVYLGAWLKVHLGGIAIEGQPGQERRIDAFHADTWGALFGGSPDAEGRDINSTYNLSCRNILVQPNQLVIFEVALFADYWIDNGLITLHFNKDPYIKCPVLVVELLSSPKVASTNARLGQRTRKRASKKPARSKRR